MIISIVNIKGGVGKSTISTTIACYLALQGKDVLLLDSDTQSSAIDWCDLRKEDDSLIRIPAVSKTYRPDIEITKIKNKYDFIITDNGGEDTITLRAIISVSDILIVPIDSGVSTCETFKSFLSLLTEGKELFPHMEAFVLPNLISPNPSLNECESTKKELEAVVNDFYKNTTFQDNPPINIVTTCIHKRRAYLKAATSGRTILELPKKDYDKKAVDEFLSVVGEILKDNLEE